MNDLIKRSDAIAEIRKARTPDVASYKYAELFINAVCRAPSAEPQTNAEQHDQRIEYVENVKRCRKCKHFERMHLYGDERIDKPGWLKWKADLIAERERRKEKNNGIR